MKHVTYLLFSVICILTVSRMASAQNWILQNSHTSAYIFSVKAVDENTVWAGAESGLFLRTTDGGANWTLKGVGGASPLAFVSIAAIDADTAYFAGTNFNGGDGRIYKTTDGGTSWTLQYQNTRPEVFFNSIAFWDERHGIAVSDAVDGSYLIVTTASGGADWKEVPAANIPPPLPGEFAGFGDSGGTPLAVAGSSHAWFGTAYGIISNDPVRVFRSSDRGQTWTVANTELGTDGQFHGISSMAFQDTLNGFAASSGSGGTGKRLARTADGGLTWSLVSSFVTTQSQVGTLVYVPQTDFGVLVATTLGGEVYSDDGGTTWKGISSGFISGGLSFASPTAGWVAGGNGTIAKFNGDLSPPTSVRNAEIPQGFSLAQNHPNPFNPSTNIQFTLAKRVHVKLKIFSILGKEVAVLVDKALMPGTHNVVFEANDLPSGVYLYRMQAEEFVQTKKLTILK